MEAPAKRAGRLEVDWESIKTGVAAGLDLRAIAERFARPPDITPQKLWEAIRKRIQRESWIVPARAIKAARAKFEETAPKAVPACVPDASLVPEKVSQSSEIGTMILENATKLAEEGSIFGLNILHGQLREASGNPAQIQPLRSAKDIVTAIRGVRLAAGMDRQDAGQVQVNVWGGSGAGFASTVPKSAFTNALEVNELPVPKDDWDSD